MNDFPLNILGILFLSDSFGNGNVLPNHILLIVKLTFAFKILFSLTFLVLYSTENLSHVFTFSITFVLKYIFYYP